VDLDHQKDLLADCHQKRTPVVWGRHPILALPRAPMAWEPGPTEAPLVLSSCTRLHHRAVAMAPVGSRQPGIGGRTDQPADAADGLALSMIQAAVLS